VGAPGPVERYVPRRAARGDAPLYAESGSDRNGQARGGARRRGADEAPAGGGPRATTCEPGSPAGADTPTGAGDAPAGRSAPVAISSSRCGGSIGRISTGS